LVAARSRPTLVMAVVGVMTMKKKKKKRGMEAKRE
jgi:hypothetical protein